MWGKSNPTPIWSLHMSSIWCKWSQKYRCSNNSIQSASEGCGGFSDDERTHIYGVEDKLWHEVQKPHFYSELPYIPIEVMTHFGFVPMSNCELDFDWETDNSIQQQLGHGETHLVNSDLNATHGRNASVAYSSNITGHGKVVSRSQTWAASSLFKSLCWACTTYWWTICTQTRKKCGRLNMQKISLRLGTKCNLPCNLSGVQCHE